MAVHPEAARHVHVSPAIHPLGAATFSQSSGQSHVPSNVRVLRSYRRDAGCRSHRSLFLQVVVTRAADTRKREVVRGPLPGPRRAHVAFDSIVSNTSDYTHDMRG